MEMFIIVPTHYLGMGKHLAQMDDTTRTHTKFKFLTMNEQINHVPVCVINDSPCGGQQCVLLAEIGHVLGQRSVGVVNDETAVHHLQQ